MQSCDVKSAIIGLLVAAGAGQTIGVSFAQQVPHNQAFNNHRFFSAPAEFRGYQRIFYQACNRSGEASAFRWEGAGFGVDAFAHLEADGCAFKNRYTDADISDVPHTVSFQGGGATSIWTWVPCYELLGADENSCEDSLAKHMYAPYHVVEAMVTRPDGTVALSAISILFEINEDQTATITIEASDAFERVILSLPLSAIDIEELREIVDVDGTDASIDMFDEISADAEPGLLTSDIPEESAAVAVPRVNSEPIKLSISDLSKLGNMIVVFGEVGGQISVRNDVVNRATSG